MREATQRPAALSKKNCLNGALCGWRSEPLNVSHLNNLIIILLIETKKGVFSLEKRRFARFNGYSPVFLLTSMRKESPSDFFFFITKTTAMTMPTMRSTTTTTMIQTQKGMPLGDEPPPFTLVEFVGEGEGIFEGKG